MSFMDNKSYKTDNFEVYLNKKCTKLVSFFKRMDVLNYRVHATIKLEVLTLPKSL